jgi:hypothetical protein
MLNKWDSQKKSVARQSDDRPAWALRNIVMILLLLII